MLLFSTYITSKNMMMIRSCFLFIDYALSIKSCRFAQIFCRFLYFQVAKPFLVCIDFYVCCSLFLDIALVLLRALLKYYFFTCFSFKFLSLLYTFYFLMVLWWNEISTWNCEIISWFFWEHIFGTLRFSFQIMLALD